MSANDIECFLRCPESSHPDILLPHGKEVIVGRGERTKIEDSRCSRNQLKVVADCQEFTVTATQLGPNSSFSNGERIGRHNSVTLQYKEKINLLENQYELKVMFNPPPSKKRKVDEKESKLTAMSPSKKNKNSQNDPVLLDRSLGTLESDDDGKGGEWRNIAGGKLYVRRPKDDSGGEKIAAFDIDGTLITTQSGNVFPKDENDWKILYPEVPGRLKQLVTEGFKLVLITNQAGIAKGKLTLAQFQKKLINIMKRLGVNPMVFVSTWDTGYYRKPRPGIWEWLELQGNNKVKVSRDESFYCGDAAGRQADFLPGRKKDFSCSDRLFADNVGLKFFTPEEFFLGHKPTKLFTRPFRPTRGDHRDMFQSSAIELVPKRQTLTLMVGIQASGKSFVSSKMESLGTEVASNDIMGGKERTLRNVESSLKKGMSVVVDNTHVDRDARKSYIDIGKKYGVNIRAFVMTTTHDHARHNNIFRELTDTKHARIKEMLLNQYRSKYSEPVEDEGFSEIVKVNFVPEFDSEALEELYYMALLEK